MALEKAFLLILTFTLLLSYSIEALPAPYPEGSGITQAPSPSLDELEFENRRKMIADKVNKALPTAEEFLQKTKKRMDETPGSSPAEQCLKSCMGTYQTIIDTIKENVDNPSSDATFGNDLKILALQGELEKCSLCDAEVVKEDPEIKKYNEWFGKYAAQLTASDGFDVENFPKLRQVMYGMIVPLSPPYDDIVRECTDFAIDEYNKKNPIKIHLVKVLKANVELCGMANFYITFVAEDDNGDSKTFQARVFDGVADDDGNPDRELTIIRIKPDSQIAASS